MTSRKSIELTPEEQADLEQSLPALLKAVENGDVAAGAWLAHWRDKRTVGEVAQEQADVIRAEVGASAPEQASLATWCGYPTDMTRCSPFFPMNVREMGHREFLRDHLITSAQWGEIRYTGPKLSTYEEDALMVLLAILEQQSQHRQQDEAEGRKTYTYKGPAWPLLRLLGYTKPGKNAYTRLIQALKLLTVAGVEISISTGKTKSGKRREPRITQMSAMLAGVHWDDKEKALIATINPFFYETYMACRVTWLDVIKRISLKGVIAKALYRFVQSHRDNPVFQGHFLTLADALNMDRAQPAYEIRRQLKTAIAELSRKGVLTRKSRFLDQDIISLERAPEALLSAEQEKLENRWYTSLK
jgi:hypothetical protein